MATGPTRATVSAARAGRQPFEVPEQWSDVSLLLFEVFHRDYPRPLEVRSPPGREASYREWIDPALGKWPENVVAKSWMRSYQSVYQIRRSTRELWTAR